MKKAFVVVAMVALLTGCTTEWTAEEKLEAFEQYTCDRAKNLSVGGLEWRVLQEKEDRSMNEVARGLTALETESDPAQCSGSTYAQFKEILWEKFGEEWSQEDAEEAGHYPLS